MFLYGFSKGVKKGYLPEEYKENAKRAYEGLTRHLVKLDDDGIATLTNCC